MDSSTLKPAAELAAKRSSPFTNESTDYANARQSLLASEIEARRLLTELAEQRSALPPGPVIEKNWHFCDAEGTEIGLLDLFDDHDTLITYFWMYGPEREAPFPMCTDTLSGLNGMAHNVRKRAAFKILGRSPVSRQLDIARDRSWNHLEFVQTVGDDYANDLGLLLDDGGEAPAFTVISAKAAPSAFSIIAKCRWTPPIPDKIRAAPRTCRRFWNVLYHTPEGRGSDWRPGLD